MGSELGESRLSEGSIKVTDKRMFTPDGRLREEFQFLEQAAAPAAPAPAAPVSPAVEPPAAQPAAPPPIEMPGMGPSPDGPSILDLVAMLAEPAALYLGEAPLPDGRVIEDLDLARLHIDLLAVLRQKTAGNLSAQESAVLDDVLYRLRVHYVQKRG